MTKVKVKKPSRVQLERKLLEAEALQIHRCHFADAYRAAIEPGSFMGSGVVLQLSAIGGREIFKPVIIKDGLSPETIEAIRADLRRSYELLTEFKPKGVV